MPNLTPERREELARAVEAGTLTLSQLQSAGLFTDYGGNDLLTSTDAALSLIGSDKVWFLSDIQVFQYWPFGYDNFTAPYTATAKFGVSRARAIIAALIRAGEGQRKGNENAQ